MRSTVVRSTAVLILLTLLLVACGGEDTTGDTTAEDGTADTDTQEDAQDEPAEQEGDAATTDQASGDETGLGELCSALAALDLSAAFAGEMTFGDVGERSATACTVPIEGAQGEGLLVQQVGADYYDVKVAQGEQLDIEVQEPDVGEAAVLLGNGDLTVLVDDSTSLTVGLSGVFGADPPPDDVLQEGITEVARQLLGTI